MEGMTGRLFKEFSIVMARNNIFLCGFDLYADVGDQATEKKRENKRLAVHENGTVLLKA